jgi:hypothetical protein
MQERRIRPATAADFHRLVDVAHERGLQLFRDGPRWYCSSASDPGGCHYVTGLSCTCRGFVAHSRCSHHALLLERLGWLPDDDTPTPAPATVEVPIIDCPDCVGCGIVHYRSFEQPCDVCAGTGLVAA